MRGRRWIFNLSCTPTKGTQSLIIMEHKAWGERERERKGMNPNFKCERMGRVMRRNRVAAPQIPSAHAPNGQI